MLEHKGDGIEFPEILLECQLLLADWTTWRKILIQKLLYQPKHKPNFQSTLQAISLWEWVSNCVQVDLWRMSKCVLGFRAWLSGCCTSVIVCVGALGLCDCLAAGLEFLRCLLWPHSSDLFCFCVSDLIMSLSDLLWVGCETEVAILVVCHSFPCFRYVENVFCSWCDSCVFNVLICNL